MTFEKAEQTIKDCAAKGEHASMRRPMIYGETRPKNTDDWFVLVWDGPVSLDKKYRQVRRID